MNSTSSLITTALLLVVAAVVIGCESDQKSDQTTNNRLSTEEFLEQHARTWNPEKVIEATSLARFFAPTLAPIPATPSGKRFDSGTPYPTPTLVPNLPLPTPVPTAQLPTPSPTNTAQSISTNVDEKFHFLEQVALMKQEIAKAGADYENAILDADNAALSLDEYLDFAETIHEDMADTYEGSLLRLRSLPVPDNREYFEFVEAQMVAWIIAQLAYLKCAEGWSMTRLDLEIGLSIVEDCETAIEDAKSYLMDAQSDYENLVNAFNRSKYIKR